MPFPTCHRLECKESLWKIFDSASVTVTLKVHTYQCDRKESTGTVLMPKSHRVRSKPTGTRSHLTTNNHTHSISITRSLHSLVTKSRQEIYSTPSVVKSLLSSICLEILVLSLCLEILPLSICLEIFYNQTATTATKKTLTKQIDYNF
jgi:hypothetical protein